MKLRDLAFAAGMVGALVLGGAARAQSFSDGSFEINRERVRFGTMGTCAKSTTFLVPTVYLYVSAREKLTAGGGLGNAGVKARVFTEGPSKAQLQALAGQVQDEIVGQLRAAGYTVLTYDDVRTDVAGKERWQPNPRYGMPTHDARAFPGVDFVLATPSDEQAISYGLTGQTGPWGEATKRTGATLLLPELYFTMPQMGGQFTHTLEGTHANIHFDPAMHLAGANIFGATPKGGWCSILVPEHGVRVPATVAGDLEELRVVDDGDDWGTKRGDYAFQVDESAFETGIRATARSLARLTVDTLKGRK